MTEAQKFTPELEINHEFKRICEQTSEAAAIGAVAAFSEAGRGDKIAADGAAVRHLREAFRHVDFDGLVVAGEGEKDEAPMLWVGEELGTGQGLSMDVAIDPLENTNSCATLNSRSLATIAMAERGKLLSVPDIYMNKIIVGPEARGKVHLDAPVKDNLLAVARSLHKPVQEIIVTILDRERNKPYIDAVRNMGARVNLIKDGDLFPGIITCLPQEMVTGVGTDMVLGIGANAEGVISAAAVRSLGGEMHARFWPRHQEDKNKLDQFGINADYLYTEEELAGGERLLTAISGVTDYDYFIKGVHFTNGHATSESLIISYDHGQVSTEKHFYKFDYSRFKDYR